MNIPENLYYTTEHEWLRVEGEVAFVGITDYAQSELGEIVFVDVNSEGEELKTGVTFGSIEAVKTVSDMFMPVDGKVLEVNGALNDKPELVNDDPYGEGWIIKLKISDPAQVEQLLSAKKYQALIG
jgi:glycine cleavage system H protein